MYRRETVNEEGIVLTIDKTYVLFMVLNIDDATSGKTLSQTLKKNEDSY